MTIKFYTFLLFVFFSCVLPVKIFSQAKGTQVQFGKNRVQYKEFDWFFHRSPSFDSYYYRGGKELAERAGKLAEQNLKEIENFLDFKLDGRVQILCYNKLSDVKQTNLGLDNDFVGNTGGLTQLIGNKLVVYFNGKTSDLKKQIRSGIAQILINQMLFGGSIQEVLQSSTLLVLPDWYISGLVSYIAEDWNADLDNKLKDGIVSGKYTKINRLIDRDAIIAGHSIWRFIVENFGKPAVSNILYMTRVNRNAESGFQYIIGIDFKNLSTQWLDYYTNIYKQDEIEKIKNSETNRYTLKNKKRTKKFQYQQAKLSPDGRTLAYMVNHQGRLKVYTMDLQSKKTKKAFVTGQKTNSYLNDANDAALTWHPSGILLAIAYEQKSNAKIEVININDPKENFKVEMYKYEKILDFSYSPNGRKWVISAIKGGQSDIFVFDIISRRDEQITNDWFDDLNPIFFKNGEKIIFSSNRNFDSLKKINYVSMPLLENKNLWMYDYLKRDNLLSAISNFPYSNEWSPKELDSNRFIFLSDKNGIKNIWEGKMDTVLEKMVDTSFGWLDTTIAVYKDTFTLSPLSNFNRNIDFLDFSSKSKKGSKIHYEEGEARMYTFNYTDVSVQENDNDKTDYKNKVDKNQEVILQNYEKKKEEDKIPDSIKKEIDSGKIDINNYYFQSEFENKRRKEIKQTFKLLNKDGEQKNKIEIEDYFKKTPGLYIPIFSTNSFVAQLDNSLINESYQLFTGSGPIYFENTTNALIKFATSDLMEDYRFIGGFRVSLANLNIPEYFVTFSNLKSRLDKSITFYKNEKNTGNEFYPSKLKTYELIGALKYPFSEFSALKLSFSGRVDEAILFSSDQFSLPIPGIHENRAGVKLEYIYDNTINKGLNLYLGTKGKVYFEKTVLLSNSKIEMKNLGFDFRHYEKIHRNIIFASRIAGAHSFGFQKVIYYLGGVDSWLFPQFKNQTQIDFTKNYFFQALATNMRGFDQNIRNGNTFLVSNFEIRFPVFSYFIKTPIKSDFIKNFQIVPFADFGSAWKGLDIFAKENRENRYIENSGSGPITVSVIEPKFPIVAGFGAGLRSRILGYFIRFDVSYGIENGSLLGRKNYFSLSLDF